MKALRFFFLSLLAAFSFAASAQTIEVYKDGRVIDSFSAAQVDSVVYKPAAAQPRYYYYAGWTKPNSETELADFAKKTADEGNGADFIAGEANMANSTVVDFTGNHTYHDEAVFYFVIPTGYKIRNAIDTDVTSTFFNNVGVLGNHTVYQRKDTSMMIPNFHITKQ